MTLIPDTHKVYVCDVCDIKSTWKKGWRSYTSIALGESAPYDVPTLCSDKCQEIFNQQMKEGKIEVPNYKPHGYAVQRVGTRKGY